MVAYDKSSGLPRADYLKEINSLRYQALEEFLVNEQTLYESKVINLEEVLEKSVLFPAELIRSMCGEKPIQMETRTTASFAKINKRKSILLAEGEGERHIRGQKFRISFADESMRELFRAKNNTKLTDQAVK